MKIRVLTGLIVFVLFLSACGGSGGAEQIQVQEPWVRATSGMSGSNVSTEGEMMSSNGAAYMILVNKGVAPDKLLRVESDVAAAVELHISEMKDGVMSMHPVEFVEVPARGQAELKPGGLHVMLVGLQHELAPGDTVDLVLVFENAGELQVQAEVRAP